MSEPNLPYDDNPGTSNSGDPARPIPPGYYPGQSTPPRYHPGYGAQPGHPATPPSLGTASPTPDTGTRDPPTPAIRNRQ
jgi:hypothetical protein